MSAWRRRLTDDWRQVGFFTQRMGRAAGAGDVRAPAVRARVRATVGLSTVVLALSACAPPAADTPLTSAARGMASPSPAASASGAPATTVPRQASQAPSSQATSSEAAPQSVSRRAGETPPPAASTEQPARTADEAGGAAADAGSPAGDDQQQNRRAKALTAVGPDDRGRQVERLQRRLARFGFAPGPVDGVYGPQTKAAVRAFQMLAGLKRHGRANAQTVAALADYTPDVTVLRAGDRGRAVRKLQRRLADGPFDPGPVDGAYGAKTVEAVWALEKLAGVPVDGDWGPLDEDAWRRLERGRIGRPAKKHGKRWVEFDLSQQVMKVYDPGSAAPVLVSHGSSGSGVPWQNEEHSGNSITPTGRFVISRRIDGWRESSLDIGRLYNPLYFNGGIAFHGALSVPLYPASHGCVRLPMHIAEYLPDELPNGTPVHVVP